MKRLPILVIFAVIFGIMLWSGSSSIAQPSGARLQTGTPSAPPLPAKQPVIRANYQGTVSEGTPSSFCWPQAAPGTQPCSFPATMPLPTPIKVADGDSVLFVIDPNTPAPTLFVVNLPDDQNRQVDIGTTNGNFKVENLPAGKHTLQVQANYPSDQTEGGFFVEYTFVLDVQSANGGGPTVIAQASATVEVTVVASATAPTIVSPQVTAPTLATSPAQGTVSVVTATPFNPITPTLTTSLEASSSPPTLILPNTPTVATAQGTVQTIAPTIAPSITPSGITPSQTPSPVPPTLTFTPTSTFTLTPPPTDTPTFTPTSTFTPTFTPTSTFTFTPTFTPTFTVTPSATPTLTPIAPLLTLKVGGRQFDPIAVTASFTDTTGTQYTITRPLSPDAERVSAAPGTTAQINFAGPHPTAITVNLLAADGVTQISSQPLPPDNLVLYTMPATPGNYVLSVEIVWPSGKSIYFYRLAVR